MEELRSWPEVHLSQDLWVILLQSQDGQGITFHIFIGIVSELSKQFKVSIVLLLVKASVELNESLLNVIMLAVFLDNNIHQSLETNEVSDLNFAVNFIFPNPGPDETFTWHHLVKKVILAHLLLEFAHCVLCVVDLQHG
jgi:hypothetical protein